MKGEEPVCVHSRRERENRKKQFYSAGFLNCQYRELVSIKYVLLKSTEENSAYFWEISVSAVI